MILNISPNFSDIKLTAKHFNLNWEEESILDCSTLIKLKTPKFSSICEIDNFENINDSAAKEFLQEIGKLSMVPGKNYRSLRDIEVNDHNVFWLTMLAVKHPQESLGKIIYLLDKVLPIIKSRLAGNNVYISLPRGSEHYRNIVLRIFKNHRIENIHVIKKSKRNLKSFLSSSLKLILFYLKGVMLFLYKKPKNKNLSFNNYFITQTHKTVDENYSDIFLKDLKRICDSGAYWPIFLSFKSLKESKLDTIKDYQKAFPTFLQVCRLLINCFTFIIRTKKVSKNSRLFFEDNTLLNFELKNGVIQNMPIFFNALWLQNFFLNHAKPVNVLYQDEFYETGRIISKTLQKCKNVTTIGIQHGLFDLHHTVYGISDVELSSVNGSPVPAPDVFVVWGEYFKDYFLSNNSFEPGRVITLGNPRYIDFSKSVEVNKKKVKKILWCVDTPELTLNDMIYLENTILNNEDFEITIRPHPVYNFLTYFRDDFKLFENHPSIRISSNNSIIKDIEAHDLVIVNCFTTAFIDAYLCGKYCFRLYPYISSSAYLKTYNSQLIFNIFSEDHLLNALQQISNFTSKISIEEECKNIMNIDVKKWQCLLDQDCQS